MTRHRFQIVLVAACLSAAGCTKEAPEEAESQAVVPVTAATAQKGTITAIVHATGTVVAAPGAELIVVAPEPARIAEMPKAEGDTVRRGDLLVRFEIPSSAAEAAKQRAEIDRGRARLANARAAQARARDLFDRGVAARKEVEDATREIADAQADIAAAEAAAAAAEAVAARSVVRANFDGVVVKRSHNPGDLVEASASDPVLRIVDPKRTEVLAAVPLESAPTIAIGARARLTVAGAAASASLKVISHPAAVQQGTATVPVRLAFTGAPNYPVGTPVQVGIETETHRDVVLVPIAAVVREGEDAAVFVVADNTAHRRAVTPGIESEQQIEIAKGVAVGDTVITSGQNGLPDGAKVMVADSTKAGEP